MCINIWAESLETDTDDGSNSEPIMKKQKNLSEPTFNLTLDLKLFVLFET